MKDDLPKYEIILNPTDGSRGSESATLHAIYLASLSGAILMPVFVVDEAVARGAGISEPIAVQQLSSRGDAVLASVKDLAEHHGVAVTPLLVKGQTSLTIVDLARDKGASLIVMGATEYSDIDRLLAHPMSISGGVLKQAPCPVMIVRAS